MFKTIASNSKGNCFLFNNELMIDAGLPFSQIRQHLSGIKCVLLTHEHGDHFRPAAIRKLVVELNPLFVCGDWMMDMIPSERKIAVEAGKVYTLGDYRISPVIAYHDVKNFGYRIMHKDYKHLHITDTEHLEGITAYEYDSASLECNHCEIRAAELIQEAAENNEFTHLIGAMNSHLSVQQSVAFCKENKIKKLYPCHIGDSCKPEVFEYLAQEGYGD